MGGGRTLAQPSWGQGSSEDIAGWPLLDRCILEWPAAFVGVQLLHTLPWREADPGLSLAGPPAWQALWMMEPKDIGDWQHREFYRFIAQAHDEPRYALHYKTDAPLNIRSIFYVPEAVSSQGDVVLCPSEAPLGRPEWQLGQQACLSPGPASRQSCLLCRNPPCLTSVASWAPAWLSTAGRS